MLMTHWDQQLNELSNHHWYGSLGVVKALLSVTVELARISGAISQLPLLLPQLECLVSDRIVGARWSELNAKSTSNVLWGGALLPLLHMSSSISSTLRRWEIFNISSPISRSSSTLERGSPTESSTSVSWVLGNVGLCCTSSSTKALKLFLEGLTFVQKTSRKLSKQPRL